jgi:hypothetical protein
VVSRKKGHRSCTKKERAQQTEAAAPANKDRAEQPETSLRGKKHRGEKSEPAAGAKKERAQKPATAAHATKSGSSSAKSPHAQGPASNKKSSRKKQK